MNVVLILGNMRYTIKVCDCFHVCALLTVDGELCPGLQFLMLSQSSVPDCAPVITTPSYP